MSLWILRVVKCIGQKRVASGVRDLNGKNRQDVATGIGFTGWHRFAGRACSTKVAAAPAAAAITECDSLTRELPEPFNPETWIPYQLQKAADVNIAIYDPRGVLVRQLSLGHQVAGQYVSAVVRRSGMVGIRSVNL